MMDFLTNRELNILKGEIEASKYAIEADKYSFIDKLNKGLGEKIKNELSAPKPKQRKVKSNIFYKISQWFRKRKEFKLYVKYDRHERAISLNEIPTELKKKGGS